MAATMNPYAPPRAEVADVDDDGDGGVQPVRTWSAQGRVGRLRYLAHSTGAYLVLMLAAFLGGVVSGALHKPALMTVVVGIAGFAYFVFVVLKSIQRAHDMDWSGWSVLLTLIPFVGLLWIFKGGTSGSNRFGAPPPPNTFGVKLLGLILPVIGIVGIVAAIALPAYQGYVKRAQMHQLQQQR